MGSQVTNQLSSLPVLLITLEYKDIAGDSYEQKYRMWPHTTSKSFKMIGNTKAKIFFDINEI